MNKQPHNLNQVAVWMPMKRDELSIRVYENYNFMEKGIIQTANTLHPVIRYAKNYTQGKQKFSLCIISREKDSKAMESFLDKVAQDITYDPNAGVFVKTEIYYGS